MFFFSCRRIKIIYLKTMNLYKSALLNGHLMICLIHVKTRFSHGIHDIYFFFNEINDIWLKV